MDLISRRIHNFMSKYTRNRSEILSNWHAQLRFLKNSMHEFDNGDEVEAVRMATTLRVMFHNTEKSKSLYNQLGDSNVVFKTSGRYFPNNLLTSWVLMSIIVDGNGSRYIPIIEENSNNRVFYLDFEDWWNEIIFDDKVNVFTRKDVVLYAANKEGGAHFDDKIPEKFSNLVKYNSLGVVDMNDDPIKGNPVYISIRTIVQEVLDSVEFVSISSENVGMYAMNNHRMEMRFRNSSARYLWSSTDIENYESTIKVISKDRKENRRLFCRYRGDKVIEYVGK